MQYLSFHMFSDVREQPRIWLTLKMVVHLQKSKCFLYLGLGFCANSDNFLYFTY